jgi:hypothetical protein
MEIRPRDEDDVPLFVSAVGATARVASRFSPEERAVIERYRREPIELVRAEILGQRLRQTARPIVDPPRGDEKPRQNP